MYGLYISLIFLIFAEHMKLNKFVSKFELLIGFVRLFFLSMLCGFICKLCVDLTVLSCLSQQLCLYGVCRYELRTDS